MRVLKPGLLELGTEEGECVWSGCCVGGPDGRKEVVG